MSDKPEKAGMNQVFICKCCARAFSDRSATTPMLIELSDVVVQVTEKVPHPKYPDDLDLATMKYVDKPMKKIKIAEREAQACCKNNTVLCSASRVRFRDIDGTIEIIGAEHLE